MGEERRHEKEANLEEKYGSQQARQLHQVGYRHDLSTIRYREEHIA